MDRLDRFLYCCFLLLASCASPPSLNAQIVVIQGSDTVSSSRTTINNNFAYLDANKSPTLTFTAPLINAVNVISCRAATGSVSGCLSAADWTTFNGKVTPDTTFSAGLPLLGAGTTHATVGSRTGNTTQFASWSGATTSAKCVHTDASGNLTVSGSDCNVSSANMTITSISGNPSGACTAGQTWYLDTTAVPPRPWLCTVSGTQRAVVTSNGTGAFSITGTFQATPSTPAAGSVTQYFDSTSKSIASIGDGGVVAYGAKNITCTNQFVKSVSGGLPACATIALSTDVSGSLPTSNQAASGLVRTCEIVIGDPGSASSPLADDNDTPAVCVNSTGATMTITAAACYAATGAPTVTPIITGGGGTSILSGACTCGTASYGTCTLNGTPTQTNGQTIDGNITSAGGTAKYLVIRVVRTL